MVISVNGNKSTEHDLKYSTRKIEMSQTQLKAVLLCGQVTWNWEEKKTIKCKTEKRKHDRNSTVMFNKTTNIHALTEKVIKD